MSTLFLKNFCIHFFNTLVRESTPARKSRPKSTFLLIQNRFYWFAVVNESLKTITPPACFLVMIKAPHSKGIPDMIEVPTILNTIPLHFQSILSLIYPQIQQQIKVMSLRKNDNSYFLLLIVTLKLTILNPTKVKSHQLILFHPFRNTKVL